jgi:hypothetical protein
MTEAKEIPAKKLPPQFHEIARLVKLMDSQFRIPGTKFTFGLDPILGLFPGLGDLVGYGISVYLLIAMVKNGASGRAVAKMVVNITLDAVIGIVPVAGQLFDFVYKANQRNLQLATEHFEEGKHTGSAWPILLPVIAVLFIIFALMVTALVLLVKWLWIAFSYLAA